MREKLEWLTLLIPGGILAALILVSMIGKGPVLEEIPERWNANDVAQLESPAPVVTKEPDTKQLKTKTEKKKKQVKTLSYDGLENGYKDGTYYGSATGYGGIIQVAVTISEGKIISVNIVSAAGETPSFLAQARAVCSKIISVQSPNVDVVSGATYSSNGIINATIAALKQAGATDLSATNTVVKTKQTPKPATPKPDSKTVIPDNVVYADGTFYGEGEGYGGMIQMKVVIAKGKMKKISVVSAVDETPEYFAKAKALIPIMLKKQTFQVDVISGATYSSNGIMEGVSKALRASIEKQKGTKEKIKTTVAPTTAPTATPAVTDVPATDAPPVVQENIAEDGTAVTVVTSTTNSSTDITGTAMCYPDDYLDFAEYPISLIFHVSVETLTTTTTSNGVEEKEEKHSYQVTGMEFSEETKNLTLAEGNWSFLKKAADGTTKYKGVFEQLLGASSPTSVDAVSGATCSSDAIFAAFQNAMGQLPK